MRHCPGWEAWPKGSSKINARDASNWRDLPHWPDEVIVLEGPARDMDSDGGMAVTDRMESCRNDELGVNEKNPATTSYLVQSHVA